MRRLKASNHWKAATSLGVRRKRNPRAAVPWACRYAFPRLRRANLTHEKNGEAWQDHGDKMALASKSLVLLGGHSRFREILVMGFPPHHRFPLQEPRSPGVPPVAGTSLMILCQTLAAILTLFPVCSLWPLWLPGITSICL